MKAHLTPTIFAPSMIIMLMNRLSVAAEGVLGYLSGPDIRSSGDESLTPQPTRTPPTSTPAAADPWQSTTSPGAASTAAAAAAAPTAAAAPVAASPWKEKDEVPRQSSPSGSPKRHAQVAVAGPAGTVALPADLEEMSPQEQASAMADAAAAAGVAPRNGEREGGAGLLLVLVGGMLRDEAWVGRRDVG